MQLGFQTIPELNAQVLETYIGVIIQNTRMCTGACLAPAAQHWGQTGLGPGAHTSPLGLASFALVVPRSLQRRLPQMRMLHVCI